MMTFDKIPTASLKLTIETLVEGRNGAEPMGFLPGDGFDKVMSPNHMLDKILTNAGFKVVDCETQGGGQYKSVTTECGIKVFRNGFCCKA